MRRAALSAAVCLALASCETAPTEIHFKLYSQGAGFSGEYNIDDSEDAFDFTSEESTSDVFVYRSSTMEIEDAITIDVFPTSAGDADDEDETDMSSLTCKIFDEDGETLYAETYTISSTHMKTFSFDLDDAEDTDAEDTDG